MRTIRQLAGITAATVYALIVLGAVVRITGSGMGCGDHWPLCNGRLIPPLDDLATVIEWTHRLMAALVSLLVVALAALALGRRRDPAVGGPGGPLRPALLAVIVLLVQVLLGAVTVWLELPPFTVILHLATAMALLATVLVAAFRADVAPPLATGAAARSGALWAAVLTGVAILLGGVTASMDAGHACQGFPLCSGQLWPKGESGLPMLQWIHRLAGYALLLYLAAYARAAGNLPEPATRAARWALGLTLTQVVVAAAMVLLALPTGWRALHVAVGTALWAVMVWWVWIAAGRPAAEGPTSR
ncbi:MAG TPA: COX15/CtaA family protein [Gemmatimonadales bacterium]|nr:COX15/CtaA family protein [Gemmatimonadales bacterium]